MGKLWRTALSVGAGLAASAAIETAAACMATQSVVTRIPPNLAAALEGATTLTLSRHWWGPAEKTSLRVRPLTAQISGADKKALVAAVQAVGDAQAQNGVRQMARLGFPVQPFRITAAHQGKTHVLTVCFECFDKKTAIAKYDGQRISVNGAAKATMARLVARQGKPSPPADAAEIKEIAEVRAAAKAKAEADKRPAANARVAIVAGSATGPVSRSRGAATGCGGSVGW